MRVLIMSDETAERVKVEDRGVVEVPVLGSIEDLVDRLMPAVPRVSASGLTEQARRNAEIRQRFLEEVSILDAAEVAALSGSRSTNPRARASRWASERRIFGVPVNGRTLYPAFQFDDQGQPRGAVSEVLKLLRSLDLSAWATAIWWHTGSDVLDWQTPAQVLPRDPDAVVAAALTDARTLGR